MNNFTIIDYKNAIRNQYKTAIENDVSGILSDPTPAQLRDFYLRLFEKGLSEIDQEILKLFFAARDNFSLKKAIENCNIGKLKPIIYFLQGRNTENRARIEMASILVNFQNRPYSRFEKYGVVVNEDTNDTSTNSESNNQQYTYVETYLENEKEPDSGKKEVEVQSETSKSNKIKYATFGVAVLLIIGIIIYPVFQEKQCMQWSNDHYDLVDCELKMNVSGAASQIEILDKSLVNLQKIKVCDTTIFFDKNGQAVVWYAKTANGIDFFNGHGRHPETNSPLRPVTRYILNKYVKK